MTKDDFNEIIETSPELFEGDEVLCPVCKTWNCHDAWKELLPSGVYSRKIECPSCHEFFDVGLGRVFQTRHYDVVQDMVESMEKNHVGFVFWTCPDGCDDVVKWNGDKTLATCGKCGKSSKGTK